jgi:hypothetical protein
MAAVADYRVQLIAKEVDDHALLVWYDPEEQDRYVEADLTPPNTTVVFDYCSCPQVH